MGTAIVTLKIMPTSPDTDLKAVEKIVVEEINNFTGLDSEKKIEIEPIAFGLKALKIIFVMKEETGSTESLEKNIANIKGVQGVEIIDVRRALG